MTEAARVEKSRKFLDEMRPLTEFVMQHYFGDNKKNENFNKN